MYGQKGLETTLNNAGRNPSEQASFVNGPIYRGSTTIYTSMTEVESMKKRFFYGTAGNPTIANLQDAWTALTGGAGTVILPSGLGAVNLVLMTVAQAGTNILMVDTAYLPTREFCSKVLGKLGVETTYYDPLITPDQLQKLLKSKPNTSTIFLESPGSQTFEVQDVPGLTAVAREHGVASVIDNTWATPVFFDAHGMGCDISIEAGTKYLSGHSDLLLGLVSANEKWYPKLKDMHITFSMTPGNEDCFLALRGMRTMHLRLKETQRRGLEIAKFMEAQPEVLKVLHPAFPSCGGHENWKRDFKGSTGLFSVILKPQYTKEDAYRMIDGMTIFQIGFSWGGFESLIMHYNCTPYRTATKFNPGGQLVRLQIGFEDMDDIKQDLLSGLARLNKAN